MANEAEIDGRENCSVHRPLQIIILGMHRSGTSALTGSLAKMGIFVGDDKEVTLPSWENPKGFFERRDARSICDDLLHSAGADWWKVSEFHPECVPHNDKARQCIRIGDLINRLDSKCDQAWALKEPRLCLLLPFYYNHLRNPLFIMIYRHPLEVANSLRKRNGFSIEAGLALWEFYVCTSLKYISNSDFLLIPYQDLVEDPEDIMSKVAARLVNRSITLSFADVLSACSNIDKDLHRNRVGRCDFGRLTSDQIALWLYLEQSSLKAAAPEVSAGARLVLRDFEEDEQAKTAIIKKVREFERRLKV